MTWTPIKYLPDHIKISRTVIYVARKLAGKWYGALAVWTDAAGVEGWTVHGFHPVDIEAALTRPTHFQLAPRLPRL